MKRTFSFLLFSISVLMSGLLVQSCSDGDTGPVETGTVSVKFDQVVGNEALTLKTGSYRNAAGEPFSVSKLNYFVSNIKFIQASGSTFTVPQDSSYFLIRQANEASQTIRLKGIPAGTYTAIEFTIGVDSLRSVSDDSRRKGILDKDMGPTNEESMYWDWNPGYIFLKLEGASDSATSANGSFYYHIGGFGGRTEKTLNNLRSTTIRFGSQAVNVSALSNPTIRVKADILTIFNGKTPFSIKKYTGVMFADFSKTIADNYAGMFSLEKIEPN